MINLIEALLGPDTGRFEASNNPIDIAIARFEGVRLATEGVKAANIDMYPVEEIKDRIHHITDKSDVLASGVEMKADKSVLEFTPITTSPTTQEQNRADNELDLRSADNVNHAMLDEIREGVVRSTEARKEIERITAPDYKPATKKHVEVPKHIDRYELPDSDPMQGSLSESATNQIAEISRKLDAIYAKMNNTDKSQLEIAA